MLDIVGAGNVEGVEWRNKYNQICTNLKGSEIFSGKNKGSEIEKQKFKGSEKMACLKKNAPDGYTPLKMSAP